jgi:phosphoribosyl 1,2-cyclic phosphodiesterase
MREALDSSRDASVRLWLLGVRGSTAAPGREYVRYGGHTSCIAIAADQEAPTLVLDAGTGLRSLTGLLPGPSFHGAILLSHLHWDHVEGIPFFRGGDHADSVVEVYLPAQDGLSGHDLLAKMMSPPNFPITPCELRGAWTFNAVQPGGFEVASFGITSAEVAHKGGRTFGYRIADRSGSIAYLPDHGPVQGCSDDVLALIRGVDLLVHDAQFLERERSTADLFGHATVDEAIRLATDGGVRTLLLFHHGPDRTDDELDAIAREVTSTMNPDSNLRILIAAEGQVIDLAG